MEIISPFYILGSILTLHVGAQDGTNNGEGTSGESTDRPAEGATESDGNDREQPTAGTNGEATEAPEGGEPTESGETQEGGTNPGETQQGESTENTAQTNAGGGSAGGVMFI